MTEQIRIDKWLWSVRLFKTRSLASDYCKKGKVIIDDIPVKPSRILQIGDIIFIKKTPVTYSYQVMGLISKRTSAKIAAEQYLDLTTQEELNKLQSKQASIFFVRDKGKGRPTKKDRRDLDKFNF